MTSRSSEYPPPHETIGVRSLGDSQNPPPEPASKLCKCPDSSPLGEMEHILFAGKVSSLSVPAIGLVDEFVNLWWAQGAATYVRVDGYASHPGNRTKNQQIACERAQAVADHLMHPSVHCLGIPESDIEVYAKGETSEFGVIAQNQRVGISMMPTPTSAPIPALPPAQQVIVDQAREEVTKALQKTVERVEVAIAAHNNRQALPQDVAQAQARFFGKMPDMDLAQLLARIKPMINWIQNIPAQLIMPLMLKSNRFLPNTPNQRQHRYNIGKMPAFAVTAPEFPPPNYIALYPDWFVNQALQAPILLHEAYHFSFPTIRLHNAKSPWTNAFAYEGFVCILGGLAISAAVNHQFPA